MEKTNTNHKQSQKKNNRSKSEINNNHVPIINRKIIFGDYFILVFLGILYVFISGFSILASYKPVWLTAISSDERKFEASIEMNKAMKYINRGQPENALILLKQSYEKAPEMPTIHLNMAIALVMLGQKEQAINALQKELKQNPWNPSNIYYFLSDIYYNNNDTATANHYFNMANNSNPSIINKYKLMANNYLNHSRFDEAIEVLLLELNYRLDMKEYYKNMLINSIESLKEEPEKVKLLENILKAGITDKDLIKYDKQLFELFLKTHYPLAQNYNQLGYCQARIGKYQEAYKNVSKAIKIAPFYPDAATNYELLKKKISQ